MRKEKRKKLLNAFIMACIGALLSLPYLARAGDLEPPSIAVDGTGNPVSTTMTPPSWGKKLPADERFELVLDDEAVLDKETGLVWEQSPDTATRSWVAAAIHCYARLVANRRGWRLPTIEELASLIDPDNYNPALPTDHPFNNVQSGFYWSSTTYPGGASLAYQVRLYNGYMLSNLKTDNYYAWCVRGGQGYDAY